jgi:hypothetical protein
VPFVLRGVETAFTEEVEKGDVVAICLASQPESGDVFVKFTVESVVNDAM